MKGFSAGGLMMAPADYLTEPTNKKGRAK